MAAHGRSAHAALIAVAAAAKLLGVGVEQLFPEAVSRDADAKVVAGHWCEVEDGRDAAPAAPRVAQERERALVAVARVDPLEPRRVEVELVQGAVLAADPVQLGQEAAERARQLLLQEVPVEAAVMVPFPPLTELAAHEQER